MPMYWTFNRFLGCIYTVYYMVYIVFLVLNWLSKLEFWLRKKGPSCPNWGQGGGLGDSGNARKKTSFFSLMSSLNKIYRIYNIEAANKLPRSVLNLTCIVHSPEVPAAIFWKHNGQVFFRFSYHIFTVLIFGQGRIPLPNRMKFWKNSKLPLTIFLKWIWSHLCKEA